MITNTTPTEYSSQIQKLIKDLMGDEAIAREKARLALVEIGKPAIDYLAELTYTDKDIWRWEAVKALGQIGERDTIPILIDALEDGNGGIRWLAAEGLSRFGIDVINPLLKALISRPTSVFLNQGVHHVLYQFQKEFNLNGIVKSFLLELKSTGSQENVLIQAKKLMGYFQNLREKGNVRKLRTH